MANKKVQRSQEVHDILSNITDDEFWTVMGSLELLDQFGNEHVAFCQDCGPRAELLRKKWGWDSSKVPIVTPSQREIRRMEGEIGNERLYFLDFYNLVEHAFRITRRQVAQ